VGKKELWLGLIDLTLVVSLKSRKVGFHIAYWKEWGEVWPLPNFMCIKGYGWISKVFFLEIECMILWKNEITNLIYMECATKRCSFLFNEEGCQVLYIIL